MHTNTRAYVFSLSLVVAILLAAPAGHARAEERIVTIGDSWAYLIADYGSLQLMLNTFFPGQGYTAVNESFGGGTAQQHATQLAEITAKINAHPTADLVYLSSGGNDFLAGLTLGGWYLGMPNESAFFDAVGGYVQTVVNHILSIRPDIQIVIGGYDYVNFWDFDLSNGGAAQALRANYALGLSGTGYIFSIPTFEVGQQQSVNTAFRALEQRKQTIAAGSRRVHYVYNFAIVNALNGYSGYFGSWPSGSAYHDLPVTKSRLGSGGGDPIHLDTTGYNILATQAYNGFFNTAFQAGVLNLNTTTIAFGNVRVGATAGGSVTASNTGPNFTKVKNLSFPAASGDFTGAGASANPLFKDPTLGSDTAAKSYGYAPTGRAPDSQALTVTSNAGNVGLTLSGTGVGPVADAPTSLDFDDLAEAGNATLDLSVSNATPDPDLAGLTNLTLLSAQITGPDAADFQLNGFTPGTVLAKGGVADLSVTFNATGDPGDKSATLTFQTDQGAPLGTAGDSVDVQLTASVIRLFALTLDVVNVTFGTVEFDPVPDDANAPSYPDGTPVLLTAVPMPDKAFRHWQIYDPNHPDDANYAATDANASTQLLMDEDKHVTAVFKCGSGAEPLLPVLGFLLAGCWLPLKRSGKT